MKLRITEIQRFCMHDGPGIRTTVFFKGCPLRCAWCHNPETQHAGQEIQFYLSRCIYCGACVQACPEEAQLLRVGAGTGAPERQFLRGKCILCLKCVSACPSGALEAVLSEVSPEEVLSEVLKDKAFYGASGGLTLSGGEPLMQAEGALALLKLAKENGITTAIETSGCFDPELINELVPLTDTFLWDFKDSDDIRHKRYTGVSGELSRANLRRADALGAVSALRCIIVRGVNSDDAHIDAVAAFWHTLANCTCAELIPYHAYGAGKAVSLGLEDNGRPGWIPEPELMRHAAERLRAQGVPVKAPEE